jgi:23S rRNA pseudouridine1911/1915/1917 synthase
VHFLREDERLRVRAHDNPVPNSKRSALSFQVVRCGRSHALLEVDLETGRKNQIRAQLEAIGHPVAGDPKHGARTNPCRRLCLHAARLSVPHPATGQALVIESPPPPEFDALARA